MAVPAKLYERSVLGALRAYKLTLSPLIGRQCRFAPSCSEYMAQALIEHGPVSGFALGVRRVCRCHPLGGSGYDPVPSAKQRDPVEEPPPRKTKS